MKFMGNMTSMYVLSTENLYRDILKTLNKSPGNLKMKFITGFGKQNFWYKSYWPLGARIFEMK